MLPIAASVAQSGESATVLPGSHSIEPCLPRWTTACAPNSVLEPPVRRDVVVARRQVGVVVDRDRVLAEAARRLDQDDQVAGLQRREHDVVAVDVQRSRRLAPVLGHRRAQALGKVVEPAAVRRGGDPHRAAGQLLGGEPVLVLAAGVDQRVDQRVAGLGRRPRAAASSTGDPREPVAEVVALLVASRAACVRRTPGCRARRRCRRGCAWSGRPTAPARSSRSRRRRVPQPGVRGRRAGHPPAPLRVGDVARQPVLVGLLEREGGGDDPAVELGDGDLGGRVQRGDAVVGGRPRGAVPGEAEPLQDRDVEVRDAPRRPTPRRRRRRCSSRAWCPRRPAR